MLLDGALNRLVAHATLVGGAINVETAQELLQDLLRAHDKKVTIEEIAKKLNYKIVDFFKEYNENNN